jgi:predicted MFS family arabinose efflux permease
MEQEAVAAQLLHEDSPPSAPQAPPTSLWRNRDYLLLLSGQSVSVLGSGISGVAYPLLALALTGSPAQAGLVGIGGFLSYLAFSLVAGVWVDRLDRRVIMVACEIGQALIAGSIPLAAAFGYLTIAQLIAANALGTTCLIFFGAAQTAAVPRVVPAGQLSAAVARNEVVLAGGQLIGPPIGGLIYQSLGRTVPMLLDAVSYAVSAITLLLLRTPLQGARTTPTRHIRLELIEGVSWLWHHALMRCLMTYNSILFFIVNASRFSLIVLARERGASASEVGLLLAIGSVGGLLGSLVAVRVQGRFSLWSVVVCGLWIQAGFCLLYAVSPTAWALSIVWAGVSFVWPIYNAPTWSRQIALTPNEMLGRMHTVGSLLFFGPTTLSAAIAGALLQTIGSAPTVLVFAAVLAVAAFTAMQNGALKAAEM